MTLGKHPVFNVKKSNVKVTRSSNSSCLRTR